MKDMYFAIRTSEDGIYITKIDDIDEFLQECCDEDEGGNVFLEDFPEDRWNKKRHQIDEENYPDEGEIVLIKGKIIVPKKVKVVEKYEIEEDV